MFILLSDYTNNGIIMGVATQGLVSSTMSADTLKLEPFIHQVYT